MTLIEAIQSGRRFRRPNHQHGWKIALDPQGYRALVGDPPDGLHQVFGHYFVALCDCSGGSGHSVMLVEESIEAVDWYVGMTDDELLTSAINILQAAGIQNFEHRIMGV